MKRVLSSLLAIIVAFCSLSNVTVFADAKYDASLKAHQIIDEILQNNVDPSYHLDNYSFSKSQAKELKSVAKKAVNGCTTNYEKIRAVTKFVAESIYYDFDYIEGREESTFYNPYEVWKKKRTVCDGYAKLTKTLLNYNNIPCMYVLGDDHAYNIAYDSDNKRWIYLDSTWCSYNRYINGEYDGDYWDEWCFDINLDVLSQMSNHEIYYLDGIVVDDIQYCLSTFGVEKWTNYNEWFIRVVGFVGDKAAVKDATIASRIGGIPVRYIDDCAFSNCTKLASITIPKGVKSIGVEAFLGCTSLRSVTIPTSVKYIFWGAFVDCNKLADVYYAGSVSKWLKIEIDECNETLTNADIHFGVAEKPTTPKLKSISNKSSGVKISWNKVLGAETYKVYRKTKGGDWECLGSTSKTRYTDKKAKSGTKYYYSIRAKNEAGNSSRSKSLSIKYLAVPTLKTPTSTRKGVSLKWTKTRGAEGYIIYRKTGSGKYQKLKTEEGVSNLSYVDKSANKGKKYTYKIKAYCGKTYSAYSDTKTIKDKY